MAIPHCLLGTGGVREDGCALLSEYVIPIALQILWIFLPTCDILFIPPKVMFF